MTAEGTHPSLIVRLADPHDARAWDEFVMIYEPMLLRLTKRWGLQDTDAQDVVQEVLIAVAAAVQRFDSYGNPGAFRAWLSRIARNKFVDHLNRTGRQPTANGGSDALLWLAQQPEQRQSESLWELELRRHAFQWAAEQVRTQVRTETWEAFFRTAVLGQSVLLVSQELKIQEGMVYVARSRVLARLRKLAEAWLTERDNQEPSDAM